jgi:hypothetical protein
MGPVLPFMACALGQAAGSPMVGMLVGKFGYADAFSVFCVIGILVAVLSPLYPGHIDYLTDDDEQPQEVEPEETGLQAAYDHQFLDEDGNPLEPVGDDEEAETEETTK